MNTDLPPHKFRQNTTGSDLVKVERPIDSWRACVWILKEQGDTPAQIAKKLSCSTELVRIQIQEWKKAPPGQGSASD